MKYIVILMFASLSYSSLAHDCLPNDYKGKIDSEKVIVVTAKGETYTQAELELHKSLPESGILQKVSVEVTRTKSDSTYAETNKLKSKMSANLDFVSRYECKHKGEYFITAIMPRSGIDYLPSDMPERIKKHLLSDDDYFNPKTFAMCKPGQQRNFIIVNWMTEYEVKAQGGVWSDKDVKTGDAYVITCGKTDLIYKYKGCSANCRWYDKTLTLWEKPFSVTYVGPNRHGPGAARDWTLEFQLQMMAKSMGLK